MKIEGPKVLVGQIWVDKDPRSNGRRIQVLEIQGEKALCKVLNPKVLGPKTTKIKLSRFRPTLSGYKLEAVEVPAPPPAPPSTQEPLPEPASEVPLPETGC